MNRFCAVSLLIASGLTATAQTESTTKRSYFSGGSEIAFSTALLDVNGSDQGAIFRFAPVVNVQQTYNKDMSDRFGLFFGLSICNNGFIYDPDTLDLRAKFRTYNLGVPVGFKIGSMNNGLLFAGYSFEWAFNYKEKQFQNEDKKEKISVWGSDRPETFQQAVFLGFQAKHGTTLKVKYYLSNFHNQDYEATVDGVKTKPYDGLNANVLSISLGFALFKDASVYSDF